MTVSFAIPDFSVLSAKAMRSSMSVRASPLNFTSPFFVGQYGYQITTGSKRVFTNFKMACTPKQ